MLQKIGFDSEKFIKLEKEAILERISHLTGRLYMEMGGKIFDDLHASRVLPGYQPDNKIKILQSLKDQLEIVICISAKDIEKNKIRADFGITYDLEVLRLIDNLKSIGLAVNSVCITLFNKQPSATKFAERLERRGEKVYYHYIIDGYPDNINKIVSEEGYGKNSYIETTKPLVVVAAPGPGSCKMATCLSQMYHEAKMGLKSGYAKFETFPVHDLPLNHPVNIAYEAATADLQDRNMIDPYHLDEYGTEEVSYNRDIEVFPVLKNIFDKILGDCMYKSPTDMGVNEVAKCIIDEQGAHTVFNDDNNMIFKSFSETTEGYLFSQGTCYYSDEIDHRVQRKFYQLDVTKKSGLAARFITVILPYGKPETFAENTIDAVFTDNVTTPAGTFRQSGASVKVTVNGVVYNLSYTL